MLLVLHGEQDITFGWDSGALDQGEGGDGERAAIRRFVGAAPVNQRQPSSDLNVGSSERGSQSTAKGGHRENAGEGSLDESSPVMTSVHSTAIYTSSWPVNNTCYEDVYLVPYGCEMILFAWYLVVIIKAIRLVFTVLLHLIPDLVPLSVSLVFLSLTCTKIY